MKVSGGTTLHASIDKAWTALNDPTVLVRTIPGCERLKATGPDSYKMVVTAGVASVKGTYTGEVALSDQQVPHSFLMKASGAGGPGTISTEVRVSLADVGDGSTTLSYDADAVAGGVVAGVGQRMLVGVAKKMAAEFFSSVDDVLTAAGAEAPAERGVFTAPAKASRAAGFSEDGFVRGLVAGAVVAPAGVMIGGLAGRRR